MIEFNVNHYVYVRLTDIGRQELRRQHDETYLRCPSIERGALEVKEDEDGWSKWQLHDLMSRLGHLCVIGFNPPFETVIRMDTDQ